MKRAVIKLASNVKKDVDSIAKQIKDISTTIGVKCKGPIPLPVRRMQHTTRKTPCGDGSHTYEKWEMRIYKRLVVIEGSGNEQAFRQIMRIAVPDTVQIEINLIE